MDKKDKKEKKDKSEKKEKKEKKEKRSGRDKKDKRRVEKKEKKHKRERHAPGPVVAHATPKWGTFGIIRESDLHEKQEEFLAWLSEVKGVPQASCGRRELQEHFGGFVEDYNTATMPSEKYYDMRKWYYQEQARLQREGNHAGIDAGDNEVVRTTFDDEAERKAELQSERAKREHALTALIAKSMHDSSSLVADMREQEAKRLKAQDAYRLGDASTARDLVQKLDPKYVSAEELRATFGGPAKATKSRPPQKQ